MALVPQLPKSLVRIYNESLLTPVDQIQEGHPHKQNTPQTLELICPRPSHIPFTDSYNSWMDKLG